MAKPTTTLWTLVSLLAAAAGWVPGAHAVVEASLSREKNAWSSTTKFKGTTTTKGARKQRRQQEDSSDLYFRHGRSTKKKDTKKKEDDNDDNSDDDDLEKETAGKSRRGKRVRGKGKKKDKEDDDDDDDDDEDDEEDEEEDDEVDEEALLTALCRNDRAIFRTCIPSSMAGTVDTRSIVLMRDEDDLLEMVGRKPPSPSSDEFTIDTSEMLVALVDGGSGGTPLATSLQNCTTLLAVEEAFLAYFMTEFDSATSHFLCAAITNVASSTASVEEGGGGANVTVTALTTTITVETSVNVPFDANSNCTAIDLVQCCLQDSVNNQTRGECASLGCDTANCPAASSEGRRGRQLWQPDQAGGPRQLQMDPSCITTEGFLSFLQCAVPMVFDNVMEEEVLLGTSVETPVLTSSCVATRQVVRAVEDARASCASFLDKGCNLVDDLGFDDLDAQCAAPEPESSTLLMEPTALCTLEFAEEDFDQFRIGEVLSITQGTDGLYYMLSRIPGGTQLTVLEIAAQLVVGGDGSAVDCSLVVADECTFAGQVVEKVAQAPVGKGGGTNLYIAGVNLAADASSPFVPFISRISGSSCRVKQGNNTRNDFVLAESASSASQALLLSSLPFFHGLALEPLRRRELWSASQSSLFADGPSDSLGDFQYFLTRFDVSTGMPTAEFKYFAETELDMAADNPALALSNNALVDFFLLDDFGSFVTLETGQVVERPPQAQPTQSPTSFPTFDFDATVPPTAMSMDFDDTVTETNEPTRAPVAAQSVAPPDPVYETVLGPRTCLYRTYVDEVFVPVGIARKDLIRCYAQEFTAITLVFTDLTTLPAANITDIDTSGRLDDDDEDDVRRRRRRRRHRALQANEARQSTDICLTDERALLAAGRTSSGATTFDVKNFVLLSNHFLQCRDCTLVLNDNVLTELLFNTGLADAATLSSQIDEVSDILDGVLESAKEAQRFFAFTDKRGRRKINRNCRRLSSRVGGFEDAVLDCNDVGFDICPLAQDILNEWENRGGTIDRCCQGP